MKIAKAAISKLTELDKQKLQTMKDVLGGSFSNWREEADEPRTGIALTSDAHDNENRLLAAFGKKPLAKDDDPVGFTYGRRVLLTLLNYLAHRNPAYICEIAAALQLPGSTVFRALDTAWDGGFLEDLQLTKAGRKYLGRITPLHNGDSRQKTEDQPTSGIIIAPGSCTNPTCGRYTVFPRQVCAFCNSQIVIDAEREQLECIP